MMQQARDFQEEVDVLAAVLVDLSNADFGIQTQFKDWTINDVIGHLYLFDQAALLTLSNRNAFSDFWQPFDAALKSGQSFRDTQRPMLGSLSGRALFDAWRETSKATADAYGATDPSQRLAWAGPDMSARSAITARQMETWAHGQAVFDILGKDRPESDRVRNICHLGVATFAWTFVNRGLDVASQPPHVRLDAPSGGIWDWNDPHSENVVSGSAVEFAQVVTQTRNIQDTHLAAEGSVALQWMQFAQCFAGAPMDPPAPNTRFKVLV